MKTILKVLAGILVLCLIYVGVVYFGLWEGVPQINKYTVDLIKSDKPEEKQIETENTGNPYDNFKNNTEETEESGEATQLGERTEDSGISDPIEEEDNIYMARGIEDFNNFIANVNPPIEKVSIYPTSDQETTYLAEIVQEISEEDTDFLRYRITVGEVRYFLAELTDSSIGVFMQPKNSQMDILSLRASAIQELPDVIKLYKHLQGEIEDIEEEIASKADIRRYNQVITKFSSKDETPERIAKGQAYLDFTKKGLLLKVNNANEVELYAQTDVENGDAGEYMESLNNLEIDYDELLEQIDGEEPKQSKEKDTDIPIDKEEEIKVGFDADEDNEDTTEDEDGDEVEEEIEEELEEDESEEVEEDTKEDKKKKVEKKSEKKPTKKRQKRTRRK